MKTKKLTLSIFGMILAGVAFGQDTNTDNHTVTVSVPAFAIMDIEPAASKDITLGFTKPNEAGSPLVAPTNSSLYLNYTCIVDATNATRKISVKLSTPISGVELSVQAAAATGTGAGNRGTVTGNPVLLTATDQDLITGIGSSYTGDGVSNGHQLTYTAAIPASNYTTLISGSHSTTVTYTISTN